MTAALTLVARPALRFQHEANVALHIEMWEKARLLDDVADALSQGDKVGCMDALLMDQHVAAGGLDETVDGAQQGSFSRAAAPEDGGGGSFFDRERNVIEQHTALRSRKGEVAKFDGCAHHPRMLCFFSVIAESLLAGHWELDNSPGQFFDLSMGYPRQTYSRASGRVCNLAARSVWPAFRAKTN